MKHRQLTFTTALLALSLCGFAQADSQEESEGAKRMTAEYERLERIKRGDGMADLTKQQSSDKYLRIRVCWGRFTVDKVESDPHIKKKDQFTLIGPFPWINYFIVTPTHQAGSDKWDGTFYLASPGSDPSEYRLSANVQPHLSSSTGILHNYDLEVRIWKDDCPKYIEIKHKNHEGEIFSPLDPGHAGASRD